MVRKNQLIQKCEKDNFQLVSFPKLKFHLGFSISKDTSGVGFSNHVKASPKIINVTLLTFGRLHLAHFVSLNIPPYVELSLINNKVPLIPVKPSFTYILPANLKLDTYL